MKITVEQIIISVQRLTVIAVPSSSDNREKAVLVHNTQYGLRVVMNASAFQPHCNTAMSLLKKVCKKSANCDKIELISQEADFLWQEEKENR
jgi:hypothetical protein